MPTTLTKPVSADLLPPGPELNARIAVVLGWKKPKSGNLWRTPKKSRSPLQDYSGNPNLALSLVNRFLKRGYQVSVEPAGGQVEAHAYADHKGEWAGVAYARGTTIPHALALLTLEMWEKKS